MARLPGINYSRGVPSLGRQDVYGPLRVAQAQASAAASIGAGIKEFSDYYRDLEIQEGENQATEALSDLTRQAEEINTNPNIDERLEQLEAIDATIATTYRDKLSATADSAFEKMYVKYSAGVLDQMARKSIFEKNEKVRKDLIISSTEMAYMGHRDEADIKIEGSSVLSDSEKAAAIEANQEQFELGLVERTALNGEVEDIQRILDGITAETYGGPLKGPQRGAAIRQLQNALILRGANDLAAAEAAKERYASDLTIAVNREQAGYTEIEYAYDNDLISGPNRTSLTLLVDKQHADGVANANAIELVRFSMEGEFPLDDRDPDHQDAVDRTYEDIKAEYARGESEVSPVLQAVNIAGRIGVLPSEVESILHSTALHGDAETVYETANIYRILKQDAPRTLRKLGTEQKSIYESTLAIAAAGPSIEEAVQTARENAFRPATEKADLRQQFQSTIANDREMYLGKIQKRMSQDNDRYDLRRKPFVGAPALEVEAFAAFKSLHQEYYTLTGGDAALSMNLAMDGFNEIFSNSSINGREQIMPFAPEREFAGAVGKLGNDAIHDDLSRFYRKHDIEKGFIKPDEITYSGELGKRSYAVYEIDEYGLPQKTLLRWSLDTEYVERLRKREFDKQDAKTKQFKESLDTWVDLSLKYPPMGI